MRRPIPVIGLCGVIPVDEMVAERLGVQLFYSEQQHILYTISKK
jgi:hypothetical protein